MSRPVAELHADWLRLVEPDGQFLSLPVLRRAFPSGLPIVPPSIRVVLSEHYPHAQRGATPGDDQWSAWLEWLLRDVLAWGPAYRCGDDAAIFTHAVPERDIVLRADAALVDPETEKPRVLVVYYPHGTPLDRRLTGERWNASPLDRLALLCRAHAVRIGLLTDGERVLLAWIPAQGPGGHAIWETGLFTESRERNLLQSFISLLHASRFFAVREGDQLESLFEESERAESDVTDRLGFQVRQAVELLIAALSRGDLESNGVLLAGIAPQRVYEAAATVMMRLVFLLFAEERDLLPLDDPFYANSYAASTLREQLDEQAIVEGDEPLERRSAAWFRLLALFRAVYAGLEHDRLRVPPYGGRLFDPDRFPFLEGRTAYESWSAAASGPLPIDDLTVRAILEALQTLPIRERGSRERRRLSFRALDVEQIGHVYEGLLDHGAVRVDDVYVGLVGKVGDEAEIPLADLEQKAREGEQPLVSFLHDFTGRSEGAVAQLIERGRTIALGGDPDARRLINTSCDNDAGLAGRVSPFFHALRRDLHDLPVVFPSQSLVVKQTRQRRSSGTEYTPRDLAEEMVRYALEPLVYSPGPRDGVEPGLWRLRSSRELLDLKICDPAVGSGAFLVSACRYLADLVVEAWIAEDPARRQSDREDLTLEARRAVVDQCLYGVDRDAMAVEMAKLSLWLVTMARERPFSFLDHSIREGDSLLGITSLDQLRFIHIDPDVGRVVQGRTLLDVTAVVRPLVEQASALRQQLQHLASNSVRDSEQKRRLNDEANRLLEQVSVIADALIATALSTAAQIEQKRNAAFQGLASLVMSTLDASQAEERRLDTLDKLRSRNDRLLNAGRPIDGPPRTTLHWALVFPEVFREPSAGFDAIVGNPPFLGGKRISGAFGSDYREFLVTVLAEGRKGNADLVSYFFLRAALLSTSFGFLAVNTIAEGDTREVGLDALIRGDWRIVRAEKTRPWPGTAGIQISEVWLSKVSSNQAPILDGRNVAIVTSYLDPLRRTAGSPFRLLANRAIAFQGSIILGMGFTMTPDAAEALIKSDPRNRDVLFPFLNADDILSRPDASPSRWIINFFEWSIERAKSYRQCFDYVERNVRPEREAKKGRVYAPARQYWWWYWNRRPGLQKAVAPLKSVIAMPFVSKFAIPVRVPSNYVYAAPMNVFANESDWMYGVLMSSVHHEWVMRYSSSLETRTRYAISDCFETFPLPSNRERIAGTVQELEIARRCFMRDERLGLTAFYNRFHDPSDNDKRLIDLRRCHASLDRAVLDGYGWTDVSLDHDFIATVEGLRFSMLEISRDEILDRLLELNHKLHRAEVAQGLVDDSGVRVDGKRKGGKNALRGDHEQPSLTGIHDDEKANES